MSRHRLLVRTSLSLRRRRGIRILGGNRDEKLLSVGCDATELKVGKHQQHAIRISNLEHP